MELKSRLSRQSSAYHHFNLTLLFLRPLCPDLSMWGHILMNLNLRKIRQSCYKEITCCIVRIYFVYNFTFVKYRIYLDSNPTWMIHWRFQVRSTHMAMTKYKDVNKQKYVFTNHNLLFFNQVRWRHLCSYITDDNVMVMVMVIMVCKAAKQD